MAVTISTNAFVNASLLDESRNSFWRPLFHQPYYNCRRVVRLNSRKLNSKVMFCLNLNTKEVGLQKPGDKGFEFKPSFDQYLQIMESVKTARKKKKFDRLKVEEDDGGGGNGDSVYEVKDMKIKSGELKDETFRKRYSRQEIVSDKRNERVFKRNGEIENHRVATDLKWSKSGESSVALKLSKSGESSVTVPEDESFRKRYSKQEYHRSSDTSRGIERGSRGDELDLVVEERRVQRIAKDARWSKSRESSVAVKWSNSGESSVTMPKDESFRRRYSKQEHHRSSDTSRGIARGSKGDELELVVEERRVQRIAKDVRWSKSDESLVPVSEDESFRRGNPKQEMVRYQRVSDTSRGIERGSKGDGLDLLAEERRIERLANERHEIRSSKLSGTRRIGAKRNDDDDDSLFAMETPAFRFSDESSDIVDKPATSRVEMEDRIEKLAKVLNGADINMPEWQFSKAIRSAKIRYTDYTVMRLIHFLGKLGNWRRVLQVIEWLQRQDRYKSNKIRIIYTTALNVLGKSRRPVEALNVFHAMLLQISSYPDMVAYRSIAVTLGQAGHIKELFYVIDTMRSPPKKKFKPTTLEKWDPRLEPDVVVYNAVLNACVQRKQWEGAFWVLQQLKQRGQKPSPVTYGLIMEVMLACEKYNLVHEFFRKMQKSSIPNALAYRVLVNTLWKEGKSDEAVHTVEDMESRGIVGSAALYYDLARCLCSAGRCNEGLNMLKKICRVANKPLVVTYTGLIQACVDSGNIKNAAYIFDQMKKVCSPNLVTCNIMLKAYLQGGLFEEARELFQKMSEDGNHIKNSSDFESRVLPDTYTFNTMLDTCAEQEKWDDFGYAYREMLRHGYHFNAKRHLRMVLEASRAGKEEVMEATWEHMRRSNRIPPSPLIKERFFRKLEKGDHISAISSLADLNGKIEETELRAFSTSAWSRVLSRFEQDSVLRLMDDVNRRLGSRSESSDSVLGNLLSSCKDYLKTRTHNL
ncbi:pentatricopeptide (PPR) repeat-containing protein [Arabidopsis thaliana]|uniref:Pentatricopeptide (PPR) repeat-containing protein n=1 Tax=Arabidopsis thaliana TaxID=3702 RepID=F4I6D9_ARATH|nr:pentatricopeptide (PPR) repeat-containing protein [Arabidopsis thaliana]AEE31250.1 pentatricopeptide (PPR) repeat-containing protein [Arabidopsis thaliana]|eukprot:NP_001185117.1 pentatricopeptide (PPR) repeat-containing protein [Arabidopsis thaliana]